MSTDTQGSLKRMLDHLELELEVTASHLTNMNDFEKQC